TRAVGSLGQFGEVVVGDESAHRHAGEGVQPRQHGVEDVPADVLVIDVDALGHRLLQLLPQVARPVVQGDVETEFTQVGDLVRAAGDADRGRTPDLRDLADDGADGTGGGGHGHGLAGLGPADLEQSRIGGEAGHAEYAEVGADRCELGI